MNKSANGDDAPRVPAGPERRSGLGLDPQAVPRRVGLSLPDTLSFASWQRIGQQIHLISDSSSWWLGDWLVFGENAFPHRYKEAVRETALGYQTLRNYAWVARRVAFAVRRDKLSFQHHAEVASLSTEEQAAWLEAAVRNGWSRNQLRREVRAARGGTSEQLLVRSPIVLQVPAEKQELWSRTAESVDRSLIEWITEVLDTAVNRLHPPELE